VRPHDVVERELMSALISRHLRARGCGVASGGNVTDEVWAEYIKNRPPAEPDDDFKMTRVRLGGNQSGLSRSPPA